MLVAALKKEVAHCIQTNLNPSPNPNPNHPNPNHPNPNHPKANHLTLATRTTQSLNALTLALPLNPAQVADYIESMFESKKEGMVVTLAPLTAITETCATPDLTTPTPRPPTAITETYACGLNPNPNTHPTHPHPAHPHPHPSPYSPQTYSPQPYSPSPYSPSPSPSTRYANGLRDHAVTAVCAL